MPEDMKRLQDEIRRFMDAHRMKQEGLAMAVGVSQGTVSRWLRKAQPTIPDAEQIRALSKLLGTDALALLDEGPVNGDGAARPPPREGYTPPPRFFSPDRNMPVFAAAEGGNGFLIVSTDPIEYLERPHTLEAVSDAYAILITGESMVPEFRPEDKAWVNPRLPPARGKPCVFYSIDEYGERKALIKLLVSWTAECWFVEQHNPPKKIKLPRPEWGQCHRIVGKFNA